ncbi:hypothetical protein ACFVUH_13045 [Kitasatospora sp. NPDC058032]|uniref:hypothetical protein n=1 Tax=Kitasatospora sp. NPDC058032 TaxID=3346307 RepID=UPI0036DC54FC
MTDPEFTAADAGERETAEDREVADELRVLLQLAAPQLPSPEDRMQRVLARVLRTRRRRRRAALAGGLAVGLTAAVLAAAPALAPGPPATALGPAASGPPADASPSASPESGAADQRTVRFRGLDDIAVDVPEGWYDLTVLPAPNHQEPVGYLASQQLSDESACPTRVGLQDSVCVSAGGLSNGGVVLALRLVRDPGAVGKYGGEELLRPALNDEDCGVMGGTQRVIGFRKLVLGGRPEVVQLTGCLRRPSKETLATLDTMVASVRPAGQASDGPLTPSALAAPTTPADRTK